MKKSFISYVSAIIFFSCLCISKTRADNFDANNFTVSSDPCAGTVTVSFWFLDRTGTESDWFNDVYLEIRNKNNSYSDFFQLFEKNYHDCQSCNKFINNYEGHDWEWKTDYSGYSCTPSYGEIGSTNRFKFTVVLSNFDEDVFGDDLSINLHGNWRDGNGADDPVNLFKTTSSTTIPDPTGLTAQSYCDRVELSWNSDNNWDCNSTVWKNIIYKNNQWLTSVGKAESYIDYSGSAGTPATYKIIAQWNPSNNGREVFSNYSNEVQAGKLALPPAPENLVFISNPEPCDTVIGISWDSPTFQPDSFEIWRKKNIISFPFQTYKLVATIGGQEDLYLDSINLLPNTTYFYKIKAKSECGLSEYSNSVLSGKAKFEPIQPSNLAVVSSGNHFLITWDDNSNDESEFILTRDGGTQKIISLPPNSNSYEDSDVTFCQTYTYSIISKNSCFTNVQADERIEALLEYDISQTFTSQSLNASKGYFPDKVVLEWSYNFGSNLDGIKIFRRRLQDTGFIQIASETSGSNIFIDLYAEAGQLYEYKIYGERQCENVTLNSNEAYSIGFRSKAGIVTGQVTYGGGTAVENVQIIANSTSGGSNQSLLFNGNGKLSIDNNSELNIDSVFLFECWLKPTDYNRNFYVFHKSNSYIFRHYNSGNKYRFEGGAGGLSMDIPEDSIPLNKYSHLAVQLRGDSIEIYINGDLISTSFFSNTIPNNTHDIEIGEDFKGYISEIRFWNISKSANKIKQDYLRYLSGTEVGLRYYFRTNESIGNWLYDISNYNNVYNKNHAVFSNNGVSWSTNGPSNEQLGILSYTDQMGNYILNIPFKSAGEIFVLTPSYLTHQFNPSTRALFIGDGALIHNSINFVDQSSFPISGFVNYLNKDSSIGCPVENASIYLDGQAIISNGTVAKTDENGSFNVHIPIGDHVITVEQAGHIYSVNRFPEIGTYNFQGPVDGLQFKDITTVKVVGRVVGGLREANKVPALAKSKNNIGVAKLIFKSQIKNGCRSDTIFTTDTTGEYIIYLPPLQYIPTVEIVNNPTINFGTLDLVDLTNATSEITKIDSLFDFDGDFIPTSPTISFNKQLDYIFISDQPKISVLDPDGIHTFIGDTSYVDESGNERNLRSMPFKWPVFHQGDDDHFYRCLIKVYEEYTNLDDNKKDSVPVTNAKLKITNELADIPSVELETSAFNTLDSITTLIYTFKPGTPNFNTNSSFPDYDFTGKLQMELEYPNGTIIPWLPLSSGDHLYRYYLLGTISNGAQFVTEGPQVPEYVLRDPPGTESSAKRSIETKRVEKSTWKWDIGSEVHVSDNLYLGAHFSIGIGVETTTEINNEVEGGFKASIKGGRNGSQSVETVNTKEWSTYAGTGISPGSNSDLYIGKSKNIQFGISEELTIIPNSYLDSIESIGNINTPGSGFTFGKKYGLSIVPGGYETHFIFNEYDIKNLIIPNLKNLRNIYLQTNSKYTSHLSITDENYGKNNDDEIFGSNASTDSPNIYDIEDLSGLSYTLDLGSSPSIFTLYNFLDSVRYFNNQIKQWEHAIFLNEWEKVNIGNKIVRDSLEELELQHLFKEYESVISAYSAAVIANTAGGILVAYGLIATPLPGSALGGYATFAVTTATSIAVAELAEEFETYLSKKQRIIDKFNSFEAPTNYTLTGGTNITSSESHSAAIEVNNTIEYGISAELKIIADNKVNNNGYGLEKGIEVNYSSGREWGHEDSEAETVEFSLNDPDIGDLYSVDVYPSMLGWGPIFKNKPGGATSCPYEPEQVTEYYNPGTEYSSRTLQIDKPEMSVSPTKLSNIPSNEAAVFNLTIHNKSEIGYTMGYDISLVGQSNPFGAIVKIDGFSNSSVVVAGGTSINKVLTIEKGPGPTYNYDSLKIVVHSQCQYTGGAGFISDIEYPIYVSAHFLPSCTDTRISTPSNLWVLNNSFNDTLPIAIVDYNINYFDLENLRLDYRPTNQSQWIGLQTFHKDTSGMNDPMAKPIPQDKSFTLYDWDVNQLTDGNYDLRVVSNCELADKNSDIHTGVIDRINPHPFGNPTPADGILSPNDEISIKFNEPIDLGSINQATNFDIRGVLNNTTVDHNISLSFDGVNDFAEIPTGVPLDNRSFTIEFSVLRDVLGEQAILCQGIDSLDQIYIGFDANNKLVFKINNNTITSVIRPFNTVGKWHNIAISYDVKNDQVQFYEASSTTTAALINSGSTTIVPKYIGNMPMEIGKKAGTNNKFFNGNIHDLRIWNSTRTLAQFSADKSKLLNGNESGLMYHWLMDEAFGNVAADHARHLDAFIDGATWQLTPNGKSANFQSSSNQYLKYKTGNVVVTDEMDFTVEFWFKGGTSGNRCLFSNGTGTGLSSDSLYSWNIEKEDTFIRIKHHGFNFQATNKSYFDNNWHHFAMVMQRTGNLSVYMDGNFESAMPSESVAQLGGAAMFIGARGFQNGPTDSLSKYFNGQIDEFRFWNVARSFEQLNRDKVNRMMGDELGLQVYLPFESYSVDPTGVKILTGTFTDQSLLIDSTQVSTATLSNTTPTIKLQRPVQSIAFNYSVNNDQIILTPTTSQELIENVTLDVTVKGIKDLHGNSMQSPKTWIAYMDMNQVVWQDESYKFSIFKGEQLSFKSAIYNRGGAAKKFNITDIPAWLTVSPSSGVIAPNSVIEINFNVDQTINLGQYNVNLGLLTDFNFKEKLMIDLKVNAKEPDWKVDKTQFENSMNFVGILKINSLNSTDVRDKIAAFIGQEVRGVAHLEYVSKIDAYRVFLTVHSNTDEAISFKIWDVSSGKIYTDVFPTSYSFLSNDIKGSLNNPIIFEASSVISYEIPVYTGWNWVSFFLDTPVYGDTSLKAKLASVADTTTQLKRDIGFITYNGSNWVGSAFTSLSPLYLYKLKKTTNDTLIIRGTVPNPSSKTITLTPVWNWIGYVSIRNQEINAALAALTPTVGDIIKNKHSFATYNGVSQGWIGSLKTLIPGEGFMYKSLAASNKTFTWPFVGMFEIVNKTATRTEQDPYWKTDHWAFNSNMTIIADVENTCGFDFSKENFGLGFKDRLGNWRGKNPITTIGGNDYNFLTLAGDEPDTLSCYLIDKAKDQIYDLHSKLNFTPNAILGNMDHPYRIVLSSELCKIVNKEELEERIIVNPVVFSNDVSVNVLIKQNDAKAQIKLIDVLGKAMFVKEIELMEGNQNIPIHLGYLNLNPAMYFLELHTNGKVFTQKLIKSK